MRAFSASVVRAPIIKKKCKICKNVNVLFIPGKVDEKATQLHAIASLKVISSKFQLGVTYPRWR